tara:strand:+ start:456 stop:602 length:147 start_codon:yes stop_codon:yes gene_type:complete
MEVIVERICTQKVVLEKQNVTQEDIDNIEWSEVPTENETIQHKESEVK